MNQPIKLLPSTIARRLRAGLFCSLLLTPMTLVSGESCCATPATAAKTETKPADASCASSCSESCADACSGSCSTGGKDLTALLDERRAASRSKMGETLANELDGYTQDLAASQIVQKAFPVGQKIPAFSLPDATGTTVQLNDLTQRGPVVLVFYRGGWCPYCNLTLSAYAEQLPALHAAGATIVAISPDLPDESLSTAERQQLPFLVLSDLNNDFARQLGIVFTLPEGLEKRYIEDFKLPLHAKKGSTSTYELPLAATYILGPDGVVRWRFVDADYSRRADPLDVLEALRTIPALRPLKTVSAR